MIAPCSNIAIARRLSVPSHYEQYNIFSNQLYGVSLTQVHSTLKCLWLHNEKRCLCLLVMCTYMLGFPHCCLQERTFINDTSYAQSITKYSRTGASDNSIVHQKWVYRSDIWYLLHRYMHSLFAFWTSLPSWKRFLHLTLALAFEMYAWLWLCMYICVCAFVPANCELQQSMLKSITVDACRAPSWLTPLWGNCISVVVATLWPLTVKASQL